MSGSTWGRAWLLAAALLAVVLLAAASAWAQAEPPRFTTPSGWRATVGEGSVSFVPATESPDTVQMLLLPPKALQADFQAQFDAERQALESQWGLVAPQPAAPQAGRVGQAQYAAHYASYDSGGGARYMAFMAAAQNGRMAVLVLVAASAEAYNRTAPQAAGLLRSLQFGP